MGELAIYAKEALRTLDESAITFWTGLKSVKDGNNELRFDFVKIHVRPASSSTFVCMCGTDIFAAQRDKNKTNRQALCVHLVKQTSCQARDQPSGGTMLSMATIGIPHQRRKKWAVLPKVC